MYSRTALGYNAVHMKEFFYTFIYTPLYNGLVFLIDVVPGGDVGIAVILLTIAVKFALFPLSVKAVRTQMLMKEIEEPLRKIQQEYKDDKQKQAEEIMKLYREKGVNPFSSILLILLQLPVIFGLYWVFFRGGLPSVDASLLYPLIPFPETVNMRFLGLIDMAGKSALLAFLAGFTQFLQARYAMPAPPQKKEGEERTFKDDLAHTMHLQMRYVLPIVVAFIAYTISAAVALYWTTSNLFTLAQEWYMRARVKREKEGENAENTA